jgi:hypothetical protein
MLSEEEKGELEQMTQSRMLAVMRARMMLLLADGLSYVKIQELLDTTAPTISRWKERFLKHRLARLPKALGPDSETASQGAGRDPGRTQRRLHAVVVPQIGSSLESQ